MPLLIVSKLAEHVLSATDHEKRRFVILLDAEENAGVFFCDRFALKLNVNRRSDVYLQRKQQKIEGISITFPPRIDYNVN